MPLLISLYKSFVLSLPFWEHSLPLVYPKTPHGRHGKKNKSSEEESYWWNRWEEEIQFVGEHNAEAEVGVNKA